MRYKLESTTDFHVELGRNATVSVLAYERPGATLPLEEKPTMSIKSTSNATASAPVAPIIE
jgi:hypothetical protein